MAVLFKEDPNVFFVNDPENAREYKEKMNPVLNGDIHFAKQTTFPISDT